MPIYVPGKLVLAKEFTPQSYMYEFPSQYPVWTPANVTTALWLDAADASTITLNGTAVSQWNDKSGTGNHAVNATAASQPTYEAASFNSRPTLRFDNSNDFLGISSPVNLASNADFFYAAVFQMNNDNFQWRMIMGGRRGFNSYFDELGGMPLLQRMQNSAQIGIHDTDKQDIRIKVDVINLFVPTIATAGRSGGTNGNGGTVTVTVTGPSQASYATTATQTWNSAASNVFQIGGRQQGATGWLNGTISECIALGRNATTDERQRIEGYLAHKWGLTSSLPADHPFRGRRPT